MNWSDALFFGLGILLGVAATVGFTAYALWKVHAWPTVPATVLRYRVRRGGEGRSYHPVVRFETLDGEVIVAFVASGGWRRRWERGEQITIQYNPRNPRCVDNGSWHTLLMPIISGAIFTASTIAFAILWRRWGA